MPAVNAAPIAFVPANRIRAADAPATERPPADVIAFRPASEIHADGFEAPAPLTTTATVAPVVDDAPAPRGDRPILLFNDQCEVCQVISAWVKKSDAAGKDLIDERPIGDPADLAKIDPSLDIWDVYQEIHVVMPDGKVKKGGEAVGEVLKRLPKTSWLKGPLAVSVFGWKPGQSALNVAYKFLDAIRPALGCQSCGGGPVQWWAQPIKWGADAVRWLKGA